MLSNLDSFPCTDSWDIFTWSVLSLHCWFVSHHASLCSMCVASIYFRIILMFVSFFCYLPDFRCLEHRFYSNQNINWNKLLICALRNLHYKISREKFEPEPGFEPQTSGFQARRSIAWHPSQEGDLNVSWHENQDCSSGRAAG